MDLQSALRISSSSSKTSKGRFNENGNSIMEQHNPEPLRLIANTIQWEGKWGKIEIYMTFEAVYKCLDSHPYKRIQL